MSIKSDIISVISPIFGDSVKAMIEQLYDDPDEIIMMARQMLSRYMGEKNADKMLQPIISKHKIKV